MKVLYLIALEPIYSCAIFETQVKTLIKEIKKQYNNSIFITLLAIFPVVHINRKGLHCIPFCHSSDINDLKKELKSHDIDIATYYVPLPRWSIYLKAYFFPIFVATALPFLAAFIWYGKYKVIHCRSYLPAFLCVLLKKMGFSITVLFDTRAPMPEQGVVSGHYGHTSWMFRFWKKIEAICLQNSDVTVAITEEFAEELYKIEPINRKEVIHNTVNVKEFSRTEEERLQLRKKLGISDNVVLVYNGSLGTWNDPELMIEVFQKLLKSIENMVFMIFTPYDRGRLLTLFKKKGIPETNFKILSLTPTQVPLYMSVGDYGIWPSKRFQGNNSIEKIHATVTGIKTFEYLAAGLPIIANENMEAVKSLVEKYKVGITFNPNNTDRMVEDFKELCMRYLDAKHACREVAASLANVEVQAKKYYLIYKDILSARM